MRKMKAGWRWIGGWKWIKEWRMKNKRWKVERMNGEDARWMEDVKWMDSQSRKKVKK